MEFDLEKARREDPFDWNLYGALADSLEERGLGDSPLCGSYREIFSQQGLGLRARAFAAFLGYRSMAVTIERSTWFGHHVHRASHWSSWTQPNPQRFVTRLDHWPTARSHAYWTMNLPDCSMPWKRDLWRVDAAGVVFGTSHNDLICQMAGDLTVHTLHRRPNGEVTALAVESQFGLIIYGHRPYDGTAH